MSLHFHFSSNSNMFNYGEPCLEEDEKEDEDDDCVTIDEVF